MEDAMSTGREQGYGRRKETLSPEKIPETGKYSALYFFLCVAQNFDFPTAVFLHFVPFVVFAAHAAFLTVAIVPPLKGF